MKLSLITPSYNSAATITRTVESVIAQNYSDLEYIIVDGASKDNTKDIVLSYQNKINIKFISESDSGIYEAMNKGVKLANGEVVGILNSDDMFDNPEVLTKVAALFDDDKIEAVYGDINYFSKDVNKTTRVWRAGEYQENKLNNGWVIPHPALFLRREVYEKCGLFRTDFKLAGDYEFILRILKIHKINLKYLPEVLVRMYNGGVSGNNLGQRIKGWKELKKAWKVNNLTLPKLFILRRIIFKLKQFLPI
ncbi:MAG: glycosyltransferase family 2 protein [Patescibacteria group bacterium]|nr:glycosyltransferase family 2 protein [Patescibacteria group bacterium]